MNDKNLIRLIEPEIPALADFSHYLDVSYAEKMFSNFGPNARELELDIERYIAADRKACLVSNCTTGITACLMALGIQGKVVLPAFTFKATAAAITNAGCVPAAVDCDVKTLEMCAESLEHELRKGDTEAIIHVRSFGFCRDLSETEDLAKRFGVPLIVDSAAAFGGTVDGNKKVGYSGVAEIFSFHATKPMAIGEGGVVLSDEGLNQRIKSIINFNADRLNTSANWGMNGKMSEFHAAIGRAALKNLPEVISGRQKTASMWMTELSQLHDLMTLPASIGQPSWQLFPIVLKRPNAHKVQAMLRSKQNLETRVYYHPTINYYDQRRSMTPRSHMLSMSTLCLPVNRFFSGELIKDLSHRIYETISSDF